MTQPLPKRDGGIPGAGEAPAPAQERAPDAEVDLPGWGVVGSRNYWGRLADGTGLRGIVRILASGVEYLPLPAGGPTPAWRPAGKQRYEMAWPTDPRPFVSLETLGHELRARWPAEPGGAASPSPPGAADLLAKLDGACRKVLDAILHLHARNRHAGLLTPKTVLLAARGAGHELVLADAGFVYKGQVGKPPAWWDDRLKELRLEEPGSEQDSTPFDPGPEVKALGRLFAEVLYGSPSVPTSALRGAPARAEVAKVLQQAIEGRLRSADQLQQELTKHPLTHHFNPPRRSKPIKLIVAAAAIAVLAGIAFTLWPGMGESSFLSQLLGKLPAQSTQPVRPDGPESMGPAMLDLKQRLEGKPRGDWVRDLEAGPRSLSQDQRVREAEELFLAQKREEYLDNWVVRLNDIAKKSEEEPTYMALNAGQQIQKMHSDLSRLHTLSTTEPSLNEKEKQCLEHAQRLLQQLGVAP